MRIILLPLVVFGLACHWPENLPQFKTEPLGNVDTAERRAKFIVDCSEAANPKSDEEGEDLVAECRRTADGLFCTPVKMVWLSGLTPDWQECSKVEDSALVKACK